MRSLVVQTPHQKLRGGIFHTGDPVVVRRDCDARIPGREGKWKTIRKGYQGIYEHPVHGDNSFALVKFREPGSSEWSHLEISPLDIDHLTT